MQYELKNRIRNQDSRKIAFTKQEELLRVLNPEWSERKKEEHLEILKGHPFDDLSGLRATYCGELRRKGLSEPEVKKLAYEKYPKNE